LRGDGASQEVKRRGERDTRNQVAKGEKIRKQPKGASPSQAVGDLTTLPEGRRENGWGGRGHVDSEAAKASARGVDHRKKESRRPSKKTPSPTLEKERGKLYGRRGRNLREVSK